MTDVIVVDPKEYAIIAERFEWFEGKFKRIQKVARELQQPEPTYKVVREEIRQKSIIDPMTGAVVDPFTGKTRTRPVLYNIVTVQGEAPKIKDWAFVASLTPGVTLLSLV
jgi:hypothetical protein